MFLHCKTARERRILLLSTIRHFERWSVNTVCIDRIFFWGRWKTEALCATKVFQEPLWLFVLRALWPLKSLESDQTMLSCDCSLSWSPGGVHHQESSPSISYIIPFHHTLSLKERVLGPHDAFKNHPKNSDLSSKHCFRHDAPKSTRMFDGFLALKQTAVMGSFSSLVIPIAPAFPEIGIHWDLILWFAKVFVGVCASMRWTFLPVPSGCLLEV